MKTNSHRKTFATIDLEAIASNTTLFKQSLAPSCQLMAVVKANGYGHGAVEVAKTALANGATYLGVAFLDEALELREAGINAPILVLGYTSPEALEQAVLHNITISVFQQEMVQVLLRLADKSSQPIKLHLKVDTGMGRIGFQTNDELVEAAKTLSSYPNIYLEGVFTHFAEADNLASAYTDLQFERFLEFTQLLENNGIEVPIKHCCNSAGTLFHKDKHLDLVRVGISLYGLRPDPALTLPLPLRQAMTLQASVASVRTLSAGSSISYGRTHHLQEVRQVATLAIGYADGLSRSLSNIGFATINGQEVPIIGRVCMDQTMLDVTGLDVARDDTAAFSIDQMAELTNTINYEIVCAVASRVPRIYRH
ncbi:alanine racemase [Alkalihalobacillus xiaoxiensis]|uniref:Alanine racemase n=1 Tax=Shouchella xiaoxiensis TaxID=766895 RepID=A0ABS2SU57_9BACI|nr:alanine racemase [Shouchella xiaoxiensis]MBM7839032.1 alanine racemase [Shouchella xiaoxiensis]